MSTEARLAAKAPVKADALEDDGAASARTNFASAIAFPFASVGAGAPLPLVAAAAGLASRRHPVTVT